MTISILTRDGKVTRNIPTSGTQKGSALMMTSLAPAGIDEQTVLIGQFDNDTKLQWRPGYDKVAIAKAALAAGIDPETMEMVEPLALDVIWAMDAPTVWQIAASDVDFSGKLKMLEMIDHPNGHGGRYCICDSTDVDLMHGMRLTRIDAAVLAAQILSLDCLDTVTNTWIV